MALADKALLRLARLAGAAALVGAIAPPHVAQAQWYPPPPPVYDPYGRPLPPPPGYYRPAPPPGYYRPRGYYQRYGQMCVTSRGTCYTGEPVPLGSRCRCMIPGFGKKRGVVER